MICWQSPPCEYSIPPLNCIMKRNALRTDNMDGLEIHFYQASTTEAHPEAHQPHICVEKLFLNSDDFPDLNLAIQIVGDTLAIIVGTLGFPPERQDSLLIFNWKTGEPQMVSSITITLLYIM